MDVHSDLISLFSFHFSSFPGEKDVIILGDFNQAPDSSDHDILRKEKFHHLVPSNTFTNISTKNPQGSKSLDNMWISRSLKKVFTGRVSVWLSHVACVSLALGQMWVILLGIQLLLLDCNYLKRACSEMGVTIFSCVKAIEQDRTTIFLGTHCVTTSLIGFSELCLLSCFRKSGYCQWVLNGLSRGTQVLKIISHLLKWLYLAIFDFDTHIAPLKQCVSRHIHSRTYLCLFHYRILSLREQYWLCNFCIV